MALSRPAAELVVASKSTQLDEAVAEGRSARNLRAAENRHLGQLERHVSTMADGLGFDLDQLLPQRGWRPVPIPAMSALGVINGSREPRL